MGSKTDSWCGKCPKCLFTWIIMSAFIPQNVLTDIFGKNLLKDKELIPILQQLNGEAEVKPFECVGTLEEVNVCLNYIIENEFVVEDVIAKLNPKYSSDINELLSAYDENNNLPAFFDSILRTNI